MTVPIHLVVCTAMRKMGKDVEAAGRSHAIPKPTLKLTTETKIKVKGHPMPLH